MTDSEISVDRLAAMIADLDDHITARAEAIAAPQVARAAADAAERIRAVTEHATRREQRDADLIAELRHQITNLRNSYNRLAAQHGERQVAA